MRLLVGAAAAVLFALIAPANAGGIGLPNGPCLLLCDPKPAPTPSPAAKSQPVGAPRDLHPPHRVYSAVAAAERRRAWRAPHASKPSGFAYRPQPAVASAPHPIPTPPRPSVVAAAAPDAAPTPAAVGPPPTAQLAANASERSPALAGAATGSDVTRPSVGPGAVGPGSDPATRLLAEAFSERPQPAPAPVPPPSPATTPKAEAVAAPPSVTTVAMVEPAPPSAFVEVTANGLVFPWWPSSFPARAAVWIISLAIVAAAAFGVAVASGRRLAA
jgi:hypothetical protein